MVSLNVEGQPCAGDSFAAHFCNLFSGDVRIDAPGTPAFWMEFNILDIAHLRAGASTSIVNFATLVRGRPNAGAGKFDVCQMNKLTGDVVILSTACKEFHLNFNLNAVVQQRELHMKEEASVGDRPSKLRDYAHCLRSFLSIINEDSILHERFNSILAELHAEESRRRFMFHAGDLPSLLMHFHKFCDLNEGSVSSALPPAPPPSPVKRAKRTAAEKAAEAFAILNPEAQD